MSFLFLFAFMRLFVLFVLVKFCHKKKKIKKFEITPDDLIHYTTIFATSSAIYVEIEAFILLSKRCLAFYENHKIIF